MNELVLSNGGFQLACRWVDEAADVQAALESFLWPWFSRVPRRGMPDLALTLMPMRAFPDHLRALCTQTMRIRQSSAALFNLEVHGGHTTSGDLVAWDEMREVGYRVNHDHGEVTVYGSLDQAFIHLIELVRYFGLLVEQSRGTVLLHASAVSVRNTDQVVGIVGAKGAGKTTTLLSMVSRGGYAYFSGDKLLLNEEDGQLRVRGWPDYPHIGIGTLRQHPALARRLGVRCTDAHDRPLPAQHKVLIPPQRFLEGIGPPERTRGALTLLLLPDVSSPPSRGETALSEADKEMVERHALFEWPHRFVTAVWHGLPLTRLDHPERVPDATWAALKRLPWLRKCGAGAPTQALEYLS